MLNRLQMELLNGRMSLSSELYAQRGMTAQCSAVGGKTKLGRKAAIRLALALQPHLIRGYAGVVQHVLVDGFLPAWHLHHAEARFDTPLF